MSTAISVRGVWKRFNRRGHGAPMLTARLADPLARRRGRDHFWALQDVNLDVDHGEVVGIVGGNGSGKSTLLRLIAGVGRPTRGSIRVAGTPGAILTLGAGFDPLRTGRENAVTAALIAGYSKRQAVAKLEEIAAFAELEEVLDDPLRTYSTGMVVRLAFSVAISTRPEMLLLDEILAVGDSRFQARCYERLGELRARGATIVVTSHDEAQLRTLCNRAIWLSRGKIAAQGTTEDVLTAYREAMRIETERRAAAVAPTSAERTDQRFGTFEAEIGSVSLLGLRHGVARHGEDRVGVAVEVVPRRTLDDPIVGVSLHRVADGTKVLDVTTEGDRIHLGRVGEPTTIELWFERLDVEPGLYRFDVGVYEHDWSVVYDYHWQAYPLEVVGPSGFGPGRSWRVTTPARR